MPKGTVMPDFRDVAAIAADRHGVITLDQLRSTGRTSRQIRSLVEWGVLHRAARAIFVIAGAPPSWRSQVLVACLAAGPDAAASHRTASALRRLDGCREGVIEVTVPMGTRRRVQGALVHQSDSLLGDQVTLVDGIPVTSPALTVLDMARYANERRLGIIADDAVRRGLTTYEELNRRDAELPGVGRRRPTRAARVLEVRPGGRVVTGSVLEDDTFELLVDVGLPEPSRQVTVHCGDRVYVADLAWVEERVIVECDGWRHHGSPAARSRDDVRRDDLQAEGWAVMTVTWLSLRDEPLAIVSNARRLLARRSGANQRVGRK